MSKYSFFIVKMNVSPIGRNSTKQERDEFEEYDKKYEIRKKFISVLEHEFPDYGLTFSIGLFIPFLSSI